MSARNKAYFMLIVVAVIWGIAGPIIKATEKEVPTLLFLTYRFYISSLIALVFFVFSPQHVVISKKSFFSLIIFALLNAPISLLLVFWGFSKTSAITGSLLSATGPMVAAIMGILFLQEHVTKREKIGLGIAFLGTVFTVLFAGNGNNGLNTIEGNLLIFASVIVGMTAGIWGKKLIRQGFSPLFLTNISFVVGFLFLVPFSFINFRTDIWILSLMSVESHLGVWYMAIFSGTIAYYLWFKAEKSIEVSETTVFHYLQPLFATPIAIIFLSEALTPAFVAGGLLIAIGVLISQIKKKRW